MSKQQEKKQALVPKLRFPEFRKGQEWTAQSLKNVAHLLDGDWIESKDQSIDGIRLIQTGNIGVGHFIPKDESIRFISEATFSRLKCTEVIPGDCLISRLPDPTGRSCLIPDIGQRMITAVDCTIVRFNLKKIVPYLFVSFSQTSQYFSEVRAQASGSTRLRISRENLSNIKIPLSTLPEQQKIADCLSSLDELITVQAQKVDALKTHKKGLMQQLFPREGETVPRLRFPEFRGAEEWEEKRLGDIGNVRMCKRIFKEQTSSVGEIPFYKIGTFGSEPDSYISKELYENYRRNYPFPKTGAVLISASGTIGRAIRYKDELAYFQDSNIVWLDNNERLILDSFLFYLYQLVDWTPSVGAIQRLYNDNIHGTQVKFPGIPEQQRIADCLSSLDDLITLETQKLEALKTHKKGLMQQLFPSNVAGAASSSVREQDALITLQDAPATRTHHHD